VLELHAIDFVDGDEVDDAITRAQPELRVDRARRERAFADAVGVMKSARTVTTLAEIANAIR
jgi:hypothetical protein